MKMRLKVFRAWTAQKWLWITYKEKIFLRKKFTTNRYAFVGLISHGGEHISIGVHRLVARTFIPKQKGRPHVNHKNGIRNDNRVENLEWSNKSENGKHAYRVLGRVPPMKGMFGKLNPWASPVLQISKKSGKKIKRWHSIADAVRAGACSGHISAVCLGLRKSSGGFIWKYA